MTENAKVPKGNTPSSSPARGSDDADEICEPCRPDAVMVICYAQQPISVPYEALEADANGQPVELVAQMVERVLINHGMQVDHTSPTWRSPGRLSIRGLGHAGACILDGRAEMAYYYEFGRYPPAGDDGLVRTAQNFGASQPLAFSGDDPEQTALEGICDLLRKTNVPAGVDFQSVYVKTADGTATTMKNMAEGQRTGGRQAYDLDGNHCMTFALDVAATGRVDVSAARNAPGFVFTQADRDAIVETVDRYASSVAMGIYIRLTGLDMEAAKAQAIEQASEAMGKMQVPSLQIAALQAIYKKLDHQPFQFEGFPARPYERK